MYKKLFKSATSTFKLVFFVCTLTLKADAIKAYQDSIFPCSQSNIKNLNPEILNTILQLFYTQEG